MCGSVSHPQLYLAEEGEEGGHVESQCPDAHSYFLTPASLNLPRNKDASLSPAPLVPSLSRRTAAPSPHCVLPEAPHFQGPLQVPVPPRVIL
jgi:hypothetical protein